VELEGELARALGGIRTGLRRGFERSASAGKTTTVVAGRREVAEAEARTRGELTYGELGGEQRSGEGRGKLTGVVAVKWARRRAGAGVGDGDRRRGSEEGDDAEPARRSSPASGDGAGRGRRRRATRRTSSLGARGTLAAAATAAEPWLRSGGVGESEGDGENGEGRAKEASGDALIPHARPRPLSIGDEGGRVCARRAR
jgi:hypothetical protein